MLKVLFVISKFVKLRVVLTPAKITLTIATSWLPTPVNLVLQEKGATKVQPAKVNVLLEHFASSFYSSISYKSKRLWVFNNGCSK